MSEILVLALGLTISLIKLHGLNSPIWVGLLIPALVIVYVVSIYVLTRDKALPLIISLYMLLDILWRAVHGSGLEGAWFTPVHDVLISTLLSDILSAVQVVMVVILFMLLAVMTSIHGLNHTTFILAYRWAAREGDICLWTGLTLITSSLLLKCLGIMPIGAFTFVYMAAAIAYLPLIISSATLSKLILFPALAVMLVTDPVTVLVQAVATDAPKRLRIMHTLTPQCTLPIRVGQVRAVLAQRPVNRLTEIGVKKIEGRNLEWGWLPLGQDSEAIICLDRRMPTHVLIVGSTGTGKSFIMHKLIRSLAKRTMAASNSTIIIIDVHGEYANRLGELGERAAVHIVRVGEKALNILETWNDTIRDHIEVLVSLFRELYHVGPLQESLLRDILAETYLRKGLELDEATVGRAPTLKELRTVTLELTKSDPRAKPLLHYIDNIASIMEGDKYLSVKDLLREGLTIIDLSTLHDEARKRLYGEILLKALFNAITALGPSRTGNIIVAVDEAHIFARRTSTLRSYLVKGILQLRKYGVFFFVATQTPRQLDREVITNTAYKIVLPLYEPEDARYTAKLMALHDSGGRVDFVVETLAKMPRGYAMYRAYFTDEPLLVKIDEG